MRIDITSLTAFHAALTGLQAHLGPIEYRVYLELARGHPLSWKQIAASICLDPSQQPYAAVSNAIYRLRRKGYNITNLRGQTYLLVKNRSPNHRPMV